MPKDFSIIAFDHTNWHSPWMNRQQVLSRLGGRGWNIVYSNGRHALWERHTDVYRRSPWLPGIQRSSNVNVDRASKVLVHAPKLGPLDRLGLHIHAAHLRSQALRSGGGLAVMIYHPAFAPYADLLKPDYLIFYLRDAYFAEPGWQLQDQRNFDDLAQRANLIVASQAEMARPIPTRQKERLLELPNGVDFELFKAGGALPEPEDIAPISKPRLGYVGRINRKVNFRLLLDLAQKRPDWNLVMVGPLGSLGSSEKEAQWAALVDRPNVHWLGNKEGSELPAYTAAIDVHLLSYDMEAAPWMAFGSPLKLYECLAAGKPIVCAPLETVSPVGGAVRIASTPGDWEGAIAAALAESGEALAATCQAIARRNSWDLRVDQLQERLLQFKDPAWISGPPGQRDSAARGFSGTMK